MSARKYFGTDGIRDAAGEGLLAPASVRAYGRAVGSWLARKADGSGARLLLGRDTRTSGPSIRDQLAEGILAFGHHLVDGGVLTTPAVQTLCREEGFDLAIVVSASHNPAGDNGIKFFGGDGLKLDDASELALEELVGASPAPEGHGHGTREDDAGAGRRYLRFLRTTCFRDLDLGGMKIVLDCAHGAGAALAPAALRSFGAELTVRGASPDGDNINDCVGVFFVESLAAPTREAGAVLGMALDGDGDRVLLVDEGGNVRDGDHMLGFLGADLKARGRLAGNRLVTTVMANMGLFAFLKEQGIEADVVPVGDRFVTERMQATGCVLGGEQSGHVIFREGARWFGDGLYTALRVLQVMKRTGRPLSELSAGVEKYPQVLINVSVREKPPVEDVPALAAACRRIEEELAETGRVVLRYSGTEPLLRVMVEGRSADVVERQAADLARVAREALGERASRS